MPSSLKTLPGRFIKAVMVLVVLPLAIGLLTSIQGQLALIAAAGATFREWLEWGFLTYVGIHVLLFRPGALFRVSRQLLSAMAVWLFGGQVTSVEEPKTGAKSSGAGKGGAEAAAQGSTLVAFSPYVVPVYTVLVCLISWAVRQWGPQRADGPTAFLIGLTVAFHWLMTADELQQSRKRWHLEMYLLALGLVFLMTLLIVAACLPLAVPEVSFVSTLAEGLATARGLYGSILQRLFL